MSFLAIGKKNGRYISNFFPKFPTTWRFLKVLDKLLMHRKNFFSDFNFSDEIIKSCIRFRFLDTKLNCLFGYRFVPRNTG